MNPVPLVPAIDRPPARRPAAPGEPRNYTVSGGMRNIAPTAQLARIAARRAFVETKQAFMQVLATTDASAPGVDWLRKQVRSAQTPEDLWLLRSAVFEVLRHDALNGARLRESLRRSLDGVFPGTYFASGFSTL
ncbi:hypothetical protein V4F39_25810 [Aquincola sp. MAHUQ-54]|uniref:Uncharacterized protein n=1 Tax=Aquincola agrisoli TaxID=3119538 RepID=A0AAW9QP79_9BURK